MADKEEENQFAAVLKRMGNVDRDPRVGEAIESFLKGKGLSAAFDPAALRVTDSLIVELGDQTTLSKAVIEAMTPTLKVAEVQHYTQLKNFRSLCSTGEFWLGSLSRRFNEGEYLGFCGAHHMAAATQRGRSGRLLAEELTDDLYFGSFAAKGEHDEPTLWSHFAGDGLGVRLTVKIISKAAQLRKIEYAQQTLLSDLNGHLLAVFGKPFVPSGLRKLAAFYLPGALSHEGEVRLLMADYPSASSRPKKVAGVWPIQLSDQADPLAQLEILEIEACDGMDVGRIRDITKGTILASVPVSQFKK